MYEECQRMPLIIRYPKAIKAGSNQCNLHECGLCSTFLDFAEWKSHRIFRELPETVLENEGKTPPIGAKAASIITTEYPQEHSVKRHYGIRTQDFKLIHFTTTSTNGNVMT